jgi:hypothetical protein
MYASPEFQRDYRLVFYRSGDVDAMLWTRIERGRVGIVRSQNTIHIPGFLLATMPGVRAVLDRNGTPVAELEGGEAAIENVFLPPGRWDVSMKADAPDFLRLSASSMPGRVVFRPNGLEIDGPGGTQSFRVSGGRGHIYSITATRITD